MNIFQVALNGSKNSINVAIFLGENPNEVEPKTGACPLHYACGSGNLSTASSLLKHGALIDCQDKQGWTPLHCASAKGHVELVKLLLDNNAEIDKAMWDGGTAVHMASKENMLSVLKELIARGANLKAQINRTKTTAYDLAIMKGHQQIINEFEKHPPVFSNRMKPKTVGTLLGMLKLWINRLISK